MAKDDDSEQLIKDKDYLRLYFQKIRSYPLLNSEEVFSLGEAQKQAYEMLLLNMLGYGQPSFSSKINELGKAALNETVKEYCPKNKLASLKNLEVASPPEEGTLEEEIKDKTKNGTNIRDKTITYSGKYVDGKNYNQFINLISLVEDLNLEGPLVSLSQLGPENSYCALMDLFYNKISRGVFRDAVKSFESKIYQKLPNLRDLIEDSNINLSPNESALVSAYLSSVKSSREVEKIREKMINSNLRLVVSIATKYHNQDLSDLINDGNTGLILAVDHYNHTIASFSTHARTWIKAVIDKELAKSYRPHNENRALFKDSGDLKRTTEYLAGRLGRSPTNEEITVFLEWDAQKFEEIRAYQKANGTIYLDDLTGEDEDSTIGESFSDNQPLSDEETFKSRLKEKVHAAIDLLPSEDEKQIIRRRFEIGYKKQTLEELSEMRRVTKECVRRKEARALSRLRKPAYGLNEFDPHRT